MSQVVELTAERDRLSRALIAAAKGALAADAEIIRLTAERDSAQRSYDDLLASFSALEQAAVQRDDLKTKIDRMNNAVEWATARVAEIVAERDALRAELNEAREEIILDDKLLTERNRVLSAIPACEDHGSQCIPHALDWIARHVATAPASAPAQGERASVAQPEAPAPAQQFCPAGHGPMGAYFGGWRCGYCGSFALPPAPGAPTAAAAILATPATTVMLTLPAAPAPAQPVVRARLTDAEIDRHTVLAKDCPPDSEVLPVRSARWLIVGAK